CSSDLKQALFNINLTLMPGEIVIVTGPSGSGKTTLLVLTGALRSVQEGTLEIMGQNLRQLSLRELVDIRRGIGFIYQAHNLFESLSARENVEIALELHSYSARQRRDMAQSLLTELGLGARLDYKPAQLSGGEKQRVAVARAMVNRPKVILADEPTAALDKESGRTVVNLLKAHAKEHGGTIILVTHDNRILDIADRIVTLIDGRIASTVSVEESIYIAALLRKCPLFQSQTPGELTEICQKMMYEEFPAGAVIIRQGEPGDKFYLIREGKTEVVVKDRDGTRVVATLGPGEVFGETALITNNPRNATVRAKEAVQTYTLDKANFVEALESSTSFKNQMLQVFAARKSTS
ncbi:MAG: ATP-binding cassette domain-containing protein, partial [Gemmataceae bacterium]